MSDYSGSLTAIVELLMNIEERVTEVRDEVYELRQMNNPKWIPTAESINALPEPIRQYIHDIETRCDPSGIVQENTVLKDAVVALAKRIEELETPSPAEKGSAR